MSPLTATELKVLEVLSDHYDETCLYSRGVAENAGISLVAARRAIKSLERRGYAELHRGLFDDDGMIAGSGYSATRAGHDFFKTALTSCLGKV